MASTYDEWLKWYEKNYPDYSQNLKEAQARLQVAQQNTVPTMGQEARAGVTTGTKGVSEKALLAGNTATGGTAGKSVQKGGIPVVGVDPKTGKPIRPAQPIYVEGGEYSYLNGLAPEDRKTLQSDMYSLGLYPKNYRPSAGFIDTEDYTAVRNLQVAGAQIGKGDVRDVLNQAKTDKNLRNYLVGLSRGNVSQTVDVTDLATAQAKLNKYFLDMFNEKPSKEEITKYKNELNAAERTSKGAISAVQAEEIMLRIASDKVSKLTRSATEGNAQAIASLDSGQLGKTIREIRNAYADNGISMDDATIYKQAAQAIRGEIAFDNVLEDIKLSAKTLWSSFSEGIDKGRSVKTQLSPWITVRSQVFGLPSDSFTISDMADVKNPDGTLKSPDEYKLYLYNTPDFKKSAKYETRTLNDLEGLTRWLGVLE